MKLFLKYFFVILGVWVAAFLLTSIPMGLIGGIRAIEKTTFEKAMPSNFATRYIAFEGVWLKSLWGYYNKKDVRIEPEEHDTNTISIKIKPKMNGTFLSVEPTIFSRVFNWSYFYAKKITIWVINEDQKALWEEWVMDSKKVYFEYQNSETTMPPPKFLLPPK